MKFKKIVLTLFIIFGITLFLPTITNIQAKSINVNKNNISFAVTYNSFEEMIKAEEKIFYENNDFSGYLSFQSAIRIGNTKKFKVIYVNDINNKK